MSYIVLTPPNNISMTLALTNIPSYAILDGTPVQFSSHPPPNGRVLGVVNGVITDVAVGDLPIQLDQGFFS